MRLLQAAAMMEDATARLLSCSCLSGLNNICGFYPAMNVIKNAHQPCSVQTRHFIRSVLSHL